MGDQAQERWQRISGETQSSASSQRIPTRNGIDFDEIFSPVVKMTSIRVIPGLVARLNLELEQMDVKTTFLHGDLNEEIYME